MTAKEKKNHGPFFSSPNR